MPLLHDVLVGEVHHPTLLDCLRTDSLRLKISSLSLSLVLADCQQNIVLLRRSNSCHLFHTLDKPLYWDVAANGIGLLQSDMGNKGIDGSIIITELRYLKTLINILLLSYFTTLIVRYLNSFPQPVGRLSLHVLIKVSRGNNVSVW